IQGETEDLGIIRLLNPGAYSGQPGNEILLSPMEVMPGDMLQVRVPYRNFGTEATTNTRLLLSIPTGTELMEHGVTKDGLSTTIELIGNHTAVVGLGDVAGRSGGEVVYHLRLVEDYAAHSVPVSANMEFTRSGIAIKE